jgi:hypothetical protein
MSRQAEVQCTSIFKNPDSVRGSVNKLWAEVITAMENTNNVSMQRHAYPNSDEFEVSDE